MSEPTHDQSLFACVYLPPMPGQVTPLRGRRFDADRSVADQSAVAPAVSAVPTRQVADDAGRVAVEPLVALAAEFSPRYERHRLDLVSIDVRGLSRLLGTPATIGAEMRREAAARGLRVHVALAPTRMAALVLATARPGLTVVNRTGMTSVLGAVPVSVLLQLEAELFPVSARVTEAQQRAADGRAAMAAFTRWGVRTLGELAALPAADLSARLGRAGRLWQAAAVGTDLAPLVPMQADEHFEATLELEWPIEGAEPLSFVLTRLLEPLATRLERRDRAAAVLHVALGLTTREVHTCRLELPTPLREVRALRTLALLDVEAHPPSGAIDRVTLTIEPTPGRILQHALFARPHPSPEQVSTLLARLYALVGQDRVGAPSGVDAHRPGAFVVERFAVDRREMDAAVPAPAAATTERPSSSALRRCRQPVPARVTADARHRPLRVSSDRRGFSGGSVLSSAGPWRTSGAWWDMDDSALATELAEAGASEATRPASRDRRRRDLGPWSRDEWDVSLSDGAVYRIFRDRTTDGWFIEGVVD